MARADCPGSYSSYACDGGASSEICSLKAGDTIWECNVTNNGDDGDATITAVYGPTSGLCGTTYYYCAWGTDAGGNSFCCAVIAETIQQVTIIGGNHDDIISLQYDSANDLQNHGGVAHVDGIVLAGDGENYITGSRKVGTDYRDKLFGGDNVDDISGMDGDDEIYGNGEGDDLDGGGGNDTINGGDGDDDIFTGPGNDTAYGGGDDDQIYGSNGNDTLHGDSGIDILCGGTGVDYLYGGPDIDGLAGAETGDIKNGGTGVGDSCDSSGTNADCEATITAEELGCP